MKIIKLNQISLFLCLLLIGNLAHPLTIADVPILQKIKQSDQTILTLNGAGIRKKFFFKVYVASLYLPQKRTQVQDILKHNEGRQLILNITHSKISQKKIVGAWNDGFSENLSTKEKQNLTKKITHFNQMFGDLYEGDQIVLDYQPKVGTTVTIKGQKKGIILGKDFNDALLKIWIGKNPVTDSLKEDLLGQ